MVKRRPPPSQKQKTISLSGFSRYRGLEECLMFAATALARANISRYDLPDYQRELLSDLIEPLDEDALAEMLAYWEYDLTRLVDRGRGWQKGIPAKPQIDIVLEITTKGNFKAEWFPRGWRDGAWFGAPEPDFPHFHRAENRQMGYHTRPSNELFFLHNVERAVGWLGYAANGPFAPLDHVLLCACGKVVERLKERLAYHFDVRMLSDLFIEFAEVDDPESESDWRETLSQVRKWEIADPEERKRKAELEELESLEERLGFSEAALLATRNLVEIRRGKSGPPPAAHTLPERIARELKKQGFSATKGSVERALELIQRHRPQPKAAEAEGGGKVLSFTRPVTSN